MSRNTPQEGNHGGLPMSGREASSGASDFEDSFLRKLREPEPLHRCPVPGQWLGGPDGRRYQILEWMGGGAMGQVFRATDETLHREVALKFLLPRPGFEEEALREARAVARLDHENIVRIFDVSEWSGARSEPGLPFLVMECLEGEPLSALLKREHLDARRALNILDGIAAGLAHAHERNLVHRDLKPGNVFLTRQGTVKLLDFGLAHLMAAIAANAPDLPTAGTPAYMAPEQWRGGPQDARTDIWAAGVVLYEMLAGRLPFTGATRAQLRERVTSADPIPSVRARNPEVPPEVESLLATTLAKDPARRFPTALELRQEVHELRARLARPGFEEPGPVTRQRRQLVLLSCQLTGVAGIVERLDAEDLGELEAAFHQSCAEVIQQHDGSVSLYMGGEVFACFGYPQVREDDAERAVRAALLLVQAIPELLQGRLPHLSLSGLSAKVGLHSDRMVLDTHAMQGEAPRVVSWLASQAGSGEVILGETAWKQVRGAFETESLGARDFPGLAGSAHLSIYRVLREREARARFERILVAGGLTPLVGREHELRRLLELWGWARERRGAFVLLRGEAGIGKSRLIQELFERVPLEKATRLRFQCWSRPGANTLPPMVEILQRLLQSVPKSTAPWDPRELEARLGAMGLPEEHVRLLGLLFSRPVPEGSPVSRLTPERRKEKTYEALMDLLLRMARQRPMLLVVEDLHWADSSWLELLGLLLDRVEGEPLLVVLSARPEFQPSWPSRDGFHRLTLERLGVEQAAALVKEVAHGTPLPQEKARELVGKTDGIPLFIEEMTRMVLEGGATASIPVTLHELLLARLDLLPSRQKALAQVCAVVGREFPLALLVPVTGSEAAELRRELAGLVEAGLLQEERKGTDEPEYQFRHALFQEAAYQSLPRGERRQHHRHIARVLKEHFSTLVEARPEVLAHHYTEAREPIAAIPYWSRAGSFALERLAIPEAVDHFTRALELRRGLPAASWDPNEELQVLAFLGFALGVMRGFDASEVERMYARAWELLQRMDEVSLRLGLCVWNTFAYHQVRAEFRRCNELAALMVRQGERQRSPEALALGHQMMSVTFIFLGRVRSAQEHSEHALAYARSIGGPYRERVLVDVLTYASAIHSVSGRLEKAREYDREVVSLARNSGEPRAVAMGLSFAAVGCLFRREVQAALWRADEVMAISSARSNWLWPAWARSIRGWVLAEQGRPREGLALVQPEVDRWRSLGLRCTETYGLGVLVGIHLKLGQLREGLRVVQDALGRAKETGERGFEVELRRLRGELLRAMGREREARYDFFRAIAVAREQGALLFELRTTVSLGRLLRDAGQPDAARAILARVYAQFEEGVDSVDLREARELLEQLSTGAGAPESPPE